MTAQATGRIDVRVVTYNVRGFRDGMGRVAAVVGELAPDVLLLQETGSRRALRRFASDLHFAVARDPRSPLRRRAKDAVLVALPWRLAGDRQVRFSRSARWYPRGALVAEIRHGAAAMHAMSVHLGLGGDERGVQAREVCALVEALGGPVVVGGDLNATPDRRAPARIASVLRDAWSEAGEGEGPTFPALAPTSRIDYVFVGGPVQIRAVSVGTGGATAASDHLPVVADLSIG